LTVNDKEEKLYSLILLTEKLGKLYNLNVTLDDYAYIQDNKDIYTYGYFMACIDAMGRDYPVRVPEHDIKQVFSTFNDAISFYHIAKKREASMIDHTIEAMKENGVEVAALVSGGFHTEGLNQIMKDQGLSYLVVMPKFANGPEFSRPYITVLTKKKKAFVSAIDQSSYTLAFEAYLSRHKAPEDLYEGLFYAIALEAADSQKDVLGVQRKWYEAYRRMRTENSPVSVAELANLLGYAVDASGDVIEEYDDDGIRTMRIQDDLIAVTWMVDGEPTHVVLVERIDGMWKISCSNETLVQYATFVRRTMRSKVGEKWASILGAGVSYSELSDLLDLRNEDKRSQRETIVADVQREMTSADESQVIDKLIDVLRRRGKSVPAQWRNNASLKNAIEKFAQVILARKAGDLPPQMHLSPQQLADVPIDRLKIARKRTVGQDAWKILRKIIKKYNFQIDEPQLELIKVKEVYSVLQVLVKVGKDNIRDLTEAEFQRVMRKVKKVSLAELIEHMRITSSAQTDKEQLNLLYNSLCVYREGTIYITDRGYESETNKLRPEVRLFDLPHEFFHHVIKDARNPKAAEIAAIYLGMLNIVTDSQRLREAKQNQHIKALFKICGFNLDEINDFRQMLSRLNREGLIGIAKLLSMSNIAFSNIIDDDIMDAADIIFNYSEMIEPLLELEKAIADIVAATMLEDGQSNEGYTAAVDLVFGSESDGFDNIMELRDVEASIVSMTGKRGSEMADLTAADVDGAMGAATAVNEIFDPLVDIDNSGSTNKRLVGNPYTHAGKLKFLKEMGIRLQKGKNSGLLLIGEERLRRGVKKALEEGVPAHAITESIVRKASEGSAVNVVNDVDEVLTVAAALDSIYVDDPGFVDEQEPVARTVGETDGADNSASQARETWLHVPAAQGEKATDDGDITDSGRQQDAPAVVRPVRKSHLRFVLGVPKWFLSRTGVAVAVLLFVFYMAGCMMQTSITETANKVTTAFAAASDDDNLTTKAIVKKDPEDEVTDNGADEAADADDPETSEEPVPEKEAVKPEDVENQTQSYGIEEWLNRDKDAYTPDYETATGRADSISRITDTIERKPISESASEEDTRARIQDAVRDIYTALSNYNGTVNPTVITDAELEELMVRVANAFPDNGMAAGYYDRPETRNKVDPITKEQYQSLFVGRVKKQLAAMQLKGIQKNRLPKFYARLVYTLGVFSDDKIDDMDIHGDMRALGLAMLLSSNTSVRYKALEILQYEHDIAQGKRARNMEMDYYYRAYMERMIIPVKQVALQKEEHESDHYYRPETTRYYRDIRLIDYFYGLDFSRGMPFADTEKMLRSARHAAGIFYGRDINPMDYDGMELTLPLAFYQRLMMPSEDFNDFIRVSKAVDKVVVNALVNRDIIAQGDLRLREELIRVAQVDYDDSVFYIERTSPLPFDSFIRLKNYTYLSIAIKKKICEYLFKGMTINEIFNNRSDEELQKIEEAIALVTDRMDAVIGEMFAHEYYQTQPVGNNVFFDAVYYVTHPYAFPEVPDQGGVLKLDRDWNNVMEVITYDSTKEEWRGVCTEHHPNSGHIYIYDKSRRGIIREHVPVQDSRYPNFYETKWYKEPQKETDKPFSEYTITIPINGRQFAIEKVEIVEDKSGVRTIVRTLHIPKERLRDAAECFGEAAPDVHRAHWYDWGGTVGKVRKSTDISDEMEVDDIAGAVLFDTIGAKADALKNITAEIERKTLPESSGEKETRTRVQEYASHVYAALVNYNSGEERTVVTDKELEDIITRIANAFPATNEAHGYYNPDYRNRTAKVTREHFQKVFAYRVIGVLKTMQEMGIDKERLPKFYSRLVYTIATLSDNKIDDMDVRGDMRALGLAMLLGSNTAVHHKVDEILKYELECARGGRHRDIKLDYYYRAYMERMIIPIQQLALQKPDHESDRWYRDDSIRYYRDKRLHDYFYGMDFSKGQPFEGSVQMLRPSADATGVFYGQELNPRDYTGMELTLPIAFYRTLMLPDRNFDDFMRVTRALDKVVVSTLVNRDVIAQGDVRLREELIRLAQTDPDAAVFYIERSSRLEMDTVIRLKNYAYLSIALKKKLCENLFEGMSLAEIFNNRSDDELGTIEEAVTFVVDRLDGILEKMFKYDYYNTQPIGNDAFYDAVYYATHPYAFPEVPDQGRVLKVDRDWVNVVEIITYDSTKEEWRGVCTEHHPNPGHVYIYDNKRDLVLREQIPVNDVRYPNMYETKHYLTPQREADMPFAEYKITVTIDGRDFVIEDVQVVRDDSGVKTVIQSFHIPGERRDEAIKKFGQNAPAVHRSRWYDWDSVMETQAIEGDKEDTTQEKQGAAAPFIPPVWCGKVRGKIPVSMVIGVIGPDEDLVAELAQELDIGGIEIVYMGDGSESYQDVMDNLEETRKFLGAYASGLLELGVLDKQAVGEAIQAFVEEANKKDEKIFALAHPEVVKLTNDIRSSISVAEETLKSAARVITERLGATMSIRAAELSIYELRIDNMRAAKSIGFDTETMVSSVKSKIGDKEEKGVAAIVHNLAELRMLAGSHREMKQLYEAKFEGKKYPINLQVILNDDNVTEENLEKMLNLADVSDIFGAHNVTLQKFDKLSQIYDFVSSRIPGISVSDVCLLRDIKDSIQIDNTGSDYLDQGMIQIAVEEGLISQLYTAGIEVIMNDGELVMLNGASLSYEYTDKPQWHCLILKPMKPIDMQQIQREMDEYEKVLMAA